MKSQYEIEMKLKELKKDLKKLELIPKFFRTEKQLLHIEFLKNNIAFIEWLFN